MSEQLYFMGDLIKEFGKSKSTILKTIKKYGLEVKGSGKQTNYPQETRLCLKKVIELRSQRKTEKEIRAALQLNEEVQTEPIVLDDKMKELLEAILKVLEGGSGLFNGRGIQIKIEIANVNLTVSPI